MWLRDPARIEGLLTCHFIAMLISSLIERTIRHAMTGAELTELSLSPEDRGCAAPTTARILEISSGVARHELTDTGDRVLRTFHPQFTELQRQGLDLLDISLSVYRTPRKCRRKLSAKCGNRVLHRPTSLYSSHTLSSATGKGPLGGSSRHGDGTTR